MAYSNLLLILQSCDTIQELSKEFKKRFGFLKFKDKIEYKKLKNKVKDKIETLKDEEWTSDYLRSMEIILLQYYEQLKDYMSNISIRKAETENPRIFRPMCFSNLDHNNIIIIEIIQDNISFTVFNTITGENLEFSSVKYISESQKKLEMICKEKIIDLLYSYLDDIYDESNVEKNMIDKIYSEYFNSSKL